MAFLCFRWLAARRALSLHASLLPQEQAFVRRAALTTNRLLQRITSEPGPTWTSPLLAGANASWPRVLWQSWRDRAQVSWLLAESSLPWPL